MPFFRKKNFSAFLTLPCTHACILIQKGLWCFFILSSTSNSIMVVVFDPVNYSIVVAMIIFLVVIYVNSPRSLKM